MWHIMIPSDVSKLSYAVTAVPIKTTSLMPFWSSLRFHYFPERSLGISLDANFLLVAAIKANSTNIRSAFDGGRIWWLSQSRWGVWWLSLNTNVPGRPSSYCWLKTRERASANAPVELLCSSMLEGLISAKGGERRVSGMKSITYLQPGLNFSNKW